jgi:hypothetical protein
MKFIPAQLAYFLQNRTAKRNLRYSVVFHFLMEAEGQGTRGSAASTGRWSP